MATQRYTQQRSLRQMGAKYWSKVLQNAFCNTFDLHYAIIGLEKTNNFYIFVSGLLRQVLLYTIKFNGYPI